MCEKCQQAATLGFEASKLVLQGFGVKSDTQMNDMSVEDRNHAIQALVLAATRTARVLGAHPGALLQQFTREVVEAYPEIAPAYEQAQAIRAGFDMGPREEHGIGFLSPNRPKPNEIN